MRTYGQFCPVARTSELLAERWTPIIVRNLLNGCRSFTQLRDGAPGIPTALLADRLRTLERCGVVTRESASGRERPTYSLTEKGRELRAVIEAMGQWGARWLEIEPHHLEPEYVLWATARLVDPDQLPARPVTVRVEVRGRPGQSFWLLLRRPSAEVCAHGAGHAEDLLLRADVTSLVDIHLRRTTYAEALRNGRLTIEGPPALARQVVSWIRPSPYADVAPAGVAPRNV